MHLACETRLEPVAKMRLVGCKVDVSDPNPREAQFLRPATDIREQGGGSSRGAGGVGRHCNAIMLENAADRCANG
jgi:hypothetical protein